MAVGYASRGLARLIVYGFILISLSWLLYSFRSSQTSRVFPSSSSQHTNPSKVLVVATHAKKVNETVWVDELPNWPHKVYIAADPNATYHTEINRGNEANHYLTYIVDNYHALPDIVVFAHHHNTGPHDDQALLSNVAAVSRLNLANVLRVGYQPLRCEDDSYDVCNPNTVWVNQANSTQYREAWAFAFGDEPCPEIVHAPCCAQFAVSRDAIRARPIEVYQRLLQWLVETEFDTFWSGRVFEYMWHLIFGKPARFCWDRDICLCEAFDICG